jgi:hypothetical protein
MGMARGPLSTPTLRILSRNDPVIPLSVCDESLFPNLNKVLCYLLFALVRHRPLPAMRFNDDRCLTCLFRR